VNSPGVQAWLSARKFAVRQRRAELGVLEAPVMRRCIVAACRGGGTRVEGVDGRERGAGAADGGKDTVGPNASGREKTAGSPERSDAPRGNG
jgi:hypothetical protein